MTLAPVAFSVTAPVKSFVASFSVIAPAPAFTVVVPTTVIVFAVWLTPTPVSERFPPASVVVRLCPIDKSPVADSVITPELVDRLPAVVSVPPLLTRLRALVPVAIAAAGSVNVVPAVALNAVFAPIVGAPSVIAFVS